MIDTGSAVMIISSAVFNEISSYVDYKLCPTDPNFKIEVADKASLRIEGVLDIHFKVRSTSFHWDMYVAEIQEDGFIGLDFLYEHDYALGAKSGLRLNRKRYPCILEKTTHCTNVVCVDTVSIPAKSEMIIKGKAENPTPTSDFGIISRLETNRIDNILVGNTLVELKDTKTGLPVRTLNSSEEDVTIKKGSVLSRLEEAVEILPFEDKELKYDNACSADKSIRVNNVPVKKKLPGHLKDLYDNSAENLNLEQKNKLYELLCDNSDLFAKSSSDLGKTSVVEHTFNTGNAKPIKQAARRPPRTLAGKENETIQEQIRTGVIRESTSPWASQMVYVMKKDGSIRPCVDYRKLNDSTLILLVGLGLTAL